LPHPSVAVRLDTPQLAKKHSSDAADAAVMESWEQLRAQARKIEGDVERALPQLASLAADGDSGAEAQRLLKTVEDHLKALARVRDSLQAEEAREPSPARKAVVERCRAVVVDYSSDVGRVAKQLRKNADRAKLFSGADDVVDLEGGPDHLKGVHRERKATTNALRGVGDVIEQAHEAQSDLASQRETLEGSTNTAQSLTDRLPSIDSIIQKMRQKKYRENAVVGVTVGCCASFLLWAVLT
jgi:flagellin-like hook-associated protein FlgL